MLPARFTGQCAGALVIGFSIFGTLGSDSRRYEFQNQAPIIDIGLRLDDVEVMGLESETVEVKNRDKRRRTLEEHSATDEEIEFLVPDVGDCRRVELNAMTSRQLVDFVEQSLEENGVEKVVPEPGVLVAHARRLIEAELTREVLAKLAGYLASFAARVALPPDLEEQVRRLFEQQPELSWDQALAEIVAGTPPEGV